jgi:hypothetical protein
MTKKIIRMTHQLEKSSSTTNTRYKKLAVQWLNEALCFEPSSKLKQNPLNVMTNFKY